jgi:hypothetical protein
VSPLALTNGSSEAPLRYLIVKADAGGSDDDRPPSPEGS